MVMAARLGSLVRFQMVGNGEGICGEKINQAYGVVSY